MVTKALTHCRPTTICEQGRRWQRAAVTALHGLRLTAVSVVVLTPLTPVAHAQQQFQLLPPEYTTVDQSFVDFAAASFRYKSLDVGIGSADRPMTFGQEFREIVSDATAGKLARAVDLAYWGTAGVAGGNASQGVIQYCGAGGTYMAVVGTSITLFCQSQGAFSPVRQDGTRLETLSGGAYRFTRGDGTTYTYTPQYSGGPALLTEIRAPSGLVATVTYTTATAGSATQSRINAVQRNDGFQLRYTYTSNVLSTTSFDWYRLIGVKAVNLTVDYCDPAALSCTYSITWPSATYTLTTQGDGSVTYTIADQAGRQTRITSSRVFSDVPYYVTGLKLPASATTDLFTYQYVQNPQLGRYISQANTPRGNWQYTPSQTPAGSLVYVAYQFQSPTGRTGAVLTIDQYDPQNISPLTSVTTADGSFFSFDNVNPANRLLQASRPDQETIDSYSYDARGNITAIVTTPTAGSGLSPLTRASAAYDSSCANTLTCNKPNWTRDAMTRQTDYTYDPNHGGILTVTLPADSNGVRPQRRFAYTQRYAWYKNSSGSIVQAPSPVWLLTAERYCRTSAYVSGSCTPTSDEVVIAYDYGPTSGANNLLLRGVTTTADSITHRTCYGYDKFGNRISETMPNAALGSCP